MHNWTKKLPGLFCRFEYWFPWGWGRLCLCGHAAPRSRSCWSWAYRVCGKRMSETSEQPVAPPAIPDALLRVWHTGGKAVKNVCACLYKHAPEKKRRIETESRVILGLILPGEQYASACMCKYIICFFFLYTFTRVWIARHGGSGELNRREEAWYCMAYFCKVSKSANETWMQKTLVSHWVMCVWADWEQVAQDVPWNWFKWDCRGSHALAEKY